MTRLLHYCYANIADVAAAETTVARQPDIATSGSASGTVRAGGSIAIGNFDGLHRGHQALLRSMHQQEGYEGEGYADCPEGAPPRSSSPPPLSNSPLPRSNSALPRPWILLTFEPHPRSFFAASKQTATPSATTSAPPSEIPWRLSTVEQKHRWLQDSDFDIDSMIVMRFDEQFSQMSARDFVQRFLLATLGAKHLVVGEDFAFGRNREGTLATLEKMSLQSAFSVHCFPTQLMGSDSSTAYSSTRARELLRVAKLDDVRTILGRDYEIEGVVIKGKGLGSELGFPTANIAPQDYCRPLYGVYYVRVLHKGISYEAVASFGKRPTLGEGLQPLLEVHFFDCPADLYGSRLRVSFEKFQREEENYPSLDALRTQIAEDVRLAKEYFRASSRNAITAEHRTGHRQRHSDVELSVG